jgi:hypothetical protein
MAHLSDGKGYLGTQNSADLQLVTGDSPKMTITSGGNVGIGTSSPNLSATNRTVLDINGTSSSILVLSTGGSAKGYVFHGGTNMAIANYNNGGSLQFNTNDGSDQTRMTITSGGVVAINNQSPNTTFLLGAKITDGTKRNGIDIINAYEATGTAGLYISCYNSYSGVVSMQVLGNGNLVNANGSYGSTSDIKIKENIIDTTPKLNDILKVRVVNYNKIGETYKQIGVIAQEVEKIFPSIVDEIADYDTTGNDLGTKTKIVKYSVFVPMLIKAIQELKAEIDTLKK